jgi:hypothetical protein
LTSPKHFGFHVSVEKSKNYALLKNQRRFLAVVSSCGLPIMVKATLYNITNKNIGGKIMDSNHKPSAAEVAGLVLIVLILLYFPYLMITEHVADVAAMSHYFK